MNENNSLSTTAKETISLANVISNLPDELIKFMLCLTLNDNSLIKAVQGTNENFNFYAISAMQQHTNLRLINKRFNQLTLATSPMQVLGVDFLVSAPKHLLSKLTVNSHIFNQILANSASIVKSYQQSINRAEFLANTSFPALIDLIILNSLQDKELKILTDRAKVDFNTTKKTLQTAYNIGKKLINTIMTDEEYQGIKAAAEVIPMQDEIDDYHYIGLGRSPALVTAYLQIVRPQTHITNIALSGVDKLAFFFKKKDNAKEKGLLMKYLNQFMDDALQDYCIGKKIMLIDFTLSAGGLRQGRDLIVRYIAEQVSIIDALNAYDKVLVDFLKQYIPEDSININELFDNQRRLKATLSIEHASEDADLTKLSSKFKSVMTQAILDESVGQINHFKSIKEYKNHLINEFFPLLDENFSPNATFWTDYFDDNGKLIKNIILTTDNLGLEMQTINYYLTQASLDSEISTFAKFKQSYIAENERELIATIAAKVGVIALIPPSHENNETIINNLSSTPVSSNIPLTLSKRVILNDALGAALHGEKFKEYSLYDKKEIQSNKFGEAEKTILKANLKVTASRFKFFKGVYNLTQKHQADVKSSESLLAVRTELDVKTKR